MSALVNEVPADIRELERGRRSQNSILRQVLRYLPPLSLIALGIAIWQIWTVVGNVPDYELPSPSSIWQNALDNHDLLLQNAVPTGEVALLGFLISLGLGLTVAIAINYSHLVELTLYPILVVSQTIPFIALAPVLVIILGFTLAPKLVIITLVCFFPIVVNTVDGFKSVDPDQVDLLRTLGAGRWRLFRDVEFPTALPYVFSGTKIAATYTPIGAIFGEWVGSSEGLGHVMIQEQGQLDTPLVFAATVLLALMAVALFIGVSVAERLLMPWYHTEKKRNALGR